MLERVARRPAFRPAFSARLYLDLASRVIYGAEIAGGALPGAKMHGDGFGAGVDGFWD